MKKRGSSTPVSASISPHQALSAKGKKNKKGKKGAPNSDTLTAFISKTPGYSGSYDLFGLVLICFNEDDSDAGIAGSFYSDLCQ